MSEQEETSAEFVNDRAMRLQDEARSIKSVTELATSESLELWDQDERDYGSEYEVGAEVSYVMPGGLANDEEPFLEYSVGPDGFVINKDDYGVLSNVNGNQDLDNVSGVEKVSDINTNDIDEEFDVDISDIREVSYNRNPFNRLEVQARFKDALEDGIEVYGADLVSEAFPVSRDGSAKYIYYAEAVEDLAKYGTFDAVAEVVEYQKDNYGEVFVESVSNPVDIANQLSQIKGGDYLAENRDTEFVKLLESDEVWNKEFDDKTREKLLDALNKDIVKEHPGLVKPSSELKKNTQVSRVDHTQASRLALNNSVSSASVKR
ncbi:MAG: hypothetical protein QM571_00030 [Micrococcaceae bacterium]